MSDHNINLLNYDAHIKTALFLDTLYSKNVQLGQFKNLRLLSATQSNNFAELQCSMQGVLLTDIRDHYPIFFINWSYITGDFDINLLNYDSHTKTALFLDTLYSKSPIPLINRPTRWVEKRHTIIDNIITYNFAELQCPMQGVLLTDISDQYPIFSINWYIENKCVNTLSLRRNLSGKELIDFSN